MFYRDSRGSYRDVWGYRRCRDVTTPRMENQMQKPIGNEMENGRVLGYRFRVYLLVMGRE